MLKQFWGGALLLAAAAVSSVAAARAPLHPTPAAPSLAASTPAGGAVQHALTPDDLGAWLDGMIPYALQRSGIPGAVVIVVKDGRPLLERGYGYADVQARRRVDPLRTLFRPGSISKTFTWTAVMQQVEAGRINLDQDVNAYLDVQIPQGFGRPVTMRNLMTHSAGFEDIGKGLIVYDSSRAASLRDALIRAMPVRIYPPGAKPAYSNWGAALAGYIVQRVSGEAFPDYVERHIFAPLGMTHASFRQPLPTRLAGDMATGYLAGPGTPKPFEYIDNAPAGALSASGDDIGRWMIAQLQDGAFQDRRILQADTARQMHAPQFRPLPGLQAMALGFYTEPGNGHRVIAHMGDTELFHSDMHLMLDDGVGLYISLNGDGKAAASYAIRTSLYRGFLDRYFPAPIPPAAADWPTAAADGRTLSGLYVNTLRSDTSWRRLPEQFLGQVKVRADADGILTVASMHDLADQPIRWREVGPFQYQEVGGPHRLAAIVRAGRPVLLAADNFPPVEALEPVSPWLSVRWNGPMFVLTLVILAVAAISWPASAALRRIYKAGPVHAGWSWRLSTATRIACWVQLAFLGGWFVFLQLAGEDPEFLGARSDHAIVMLEVLGWLGVLGALAAVCNAGVAARDPSRRLWGRAAPSLIAAACVCAVVFAFNFRLVDSGLAY